MKVVLTIDEAKEYLGFAFVEAVFPGKPMKVTAVNWDKYGHEVSITLEADGEEFIKAKTSRDQLASSPPPAPSPCSGAEKSARDVATKLNYGYSGDVDPI